MRILAGYNGSVASKSALADLKNAGLPAPTQVLVLSVAELWIAPRSAEEAAAAAAEAKSFLTSNFPNWSVYAETAAGSPAREILARAETYKPDLIVLGEPLHNAGDSGVYLGQTSKTVLSQAECPVRISRSNELGSEHPNRILVGFDGSAAAFRAVESIAAKSWSNSPEVRLLAVTNLGLLSDLRGSVNGEISAVDTSEISRWSQSVASTALTRLTNAGLRASLQTRLGQAKDVIVDEASKWGADMVFVGPHGSANSFDRFLLGSVSAAVAARAHCSVEVVRPVTY